jgi:uncharacterized protein (DUF433 family)/DNA-binding transcriptional MerR regulator
VDASTDVAASHVAVTPETAARLVGVTLRRVDYWRDTGLVVPGVVSSLGTRREVRLYRLPELVELRTVAELRRTGISLQHIRNIVEYLRAHYDAPLRELRFGVYAGEVYFQHPDGTWEGDRAPGQIVLRGAVPVEGFRNELLHRIAEGGRRPDEVGRVVRRRRVHGSQPVFDGTRVPVSAVQAYLERGYGTEQILAAYPHLTEADIDAARQYVAA